MKDDEADRTPIELLADAVDRFGAVSLFLVTLAITLALLIMGNTLARLIGDALLVACFIGVARRRRRLARPTFPE